MDAGKSNKVTVKPGAVVEFVKTTLKGEITIDLGTVIHPTVQILAEGGPIIIGRHNLIEEGVVIRNRPSVDGTKRTMVIGDNNVFEVRSYTEALQVGSNNIIQMTAKLGAGVTLGNGCVVSVGMDLNHTHLDDKTRIYFSDGVVQRTTAADLPPSQNQQLEYLRNMIPNYHKNIQANCSRIADHHRLLFCKCTFTVFAPTMCQY